jgi:hypothetical protein
VDYQENRQFNKIIINNNINDNDRNFDKRLSNDLMNQNNIINQKCNIYYNNYPNPEPMPIRVNRANNRTNNILNQLNENEEMKYNEKSIYKNRKEDNNILYLLSSLNLENLYDIFISNYISFNDLFLLTKVDFVEMKIPIGPRNRIMHFISEYKKYGKNFDFQELSNFLNYYKNNLNKPIIKDLSINEFFITTNNTNNINSDSSSFFNGPIINNYVNNDENSLKKQIIEKTNLFLNKDKEKEFIDSKNILCNNSNKCNDLINLINYSKEKANVIIIQLNQN